MNEITNMVKINKDDAIVLGDSGLLAKNLNGGEIEVLLPYPKCKDYLAKFELFKSLLRGKDEFLYKKFMEANENYIKPSVIINCLNGKLVYMNNQITNIEVTVYDNKTYIRLYVKLGSIFNFILTKNEDIDIVADFKNDLCIKDTGVLSYHNGNKHKMMSVIYRAI